MMKNATKTIVIYLLKNGKMSGRDIMANTGVDEIDISDAEMENEIVRTKPSGCGVWYRVTR